MHTMIISRRHWLGTWALAPLLAPTSCSTADDIVHAKQASAVLHDHFNNQRYDTILVQASDEYRQSVSVEQNRELFRGLRDKLGTATDSNVVGFRTMFSDAGRSLILTCSTKYQRGEAIETFTWRLTDGKILLMGYQVNNITLRPS